MKLDQQLDHLDSEGLLRRVQSDPELEYLFRHVLTQEAAYASLLKQDRRRLHHAVGEALEREYGQHVDEIAPVLAQHFDEAEDAARALHYFMRAGEAAARRHANTEACMLYGRALEIALQSKAPSDVLTSLYLRYGRLSEITGGYVKALTAYLEMGMLAQERADQRMLLAALIARATVHAAPTTINDSALGEELARRALDLARELGDQDAEAKAHWLLCLALRFTPQGGLAIEHGRIAAQLAHDRGLHELQAYALNDLFPVYMGERRVNDGRAALDEALQLAHRINNLPLSVDIWTNHAELDLFSGNLPAASAMINQAVEVADRLSNPWGQSYSRWVLGTLLIERGEIGAGTRELERCIELGAQAGFAFSQIATGSILAAVYAEIGAYAAGIAAAEQSLRYAETLRPDLQGGGLAALALCLVGLGQFEQARTAVEQAARFGSIVDLSTLIISVAAAEIELAAGAPERALAQAEAARAELEGMDMRLFLPLADYYRGAALLGLGQLEAAREALAAAARAARQLDVHRHLWRILLASAACQARRGDASAAQALRAEAQAEIARINDSLGSEALQSAFAARVAQQSRMLGA